MKRLSFWEVRTATLRGKRQLAVPKAICHHDGWKPGDKLTVTIEDDDNFRVTRRKEVD